MVIKMLTPGIVHFLAGCGLGSLTTFFMINQVIDESKVSADQQLEKLRNEVLSLHK